MRRFRYRARQAVIGCFLYYVTVQVSGQVAQRRDNHASSRHEACFVTVRAIAVVCVVEGEAVGFAYYFEVYLFRFNCFDFNFQIRLTYVADLCRQLYYVMFDPSVVARDALADYLRDEAMDARDGRVVFPYRIVCAFEVITSTDLYVGCNEDANLGDVDHYSIDFCNDQRGCFLVVDGLVKRLLAVDVGRGGLDDIDRLRLEESVARKCLCRFANALRDNKVYCYGDGHLTLDADGTCGDGYGGRGWLFRLFIIDLVVGPRETRCSSTLRRGYVLSLVSIIFQCVPECRHRHVVHIHLRDRGRLGPKALRILPNLPRFPGKRPRS